MRLCARSIPDNVFICMHRPIISSEICRFLSNMDELNVTVETAYRTCPQWTSRTCQRAYSALSSSRYELSRAAVNETWYQSTPSNDELLLFYHQINLSARAHCSLGETASLQLRTSQTEHFTLTSV